MPVGDFLRSASRRPYGPRAHEARADTHGDVPWDRSFQGILFPNAPGRVKPLRQRAIRVHPLHTSPRLARSLSRRRIRARLHHPPARQPPHHLTPGGSEQSDPTPPASPPRHAHRPPPQSRRMVPAAARNLTRPDDPHVLAYKPRKLPVTREKQNPRHVEARRGFLGPL